MSRTIAAPICLILVLGSGCFTGEAPQSYTCAGDKDCPPGQVCGASGRCGKPGNPGSDAIPDRRPDFTRPDISQSDVSRLEIGQLDVTPFSDLRTDRAADQMPGVDASCAGTPTSCGAPGACVDCTSSVAGHTCVNGTCGCLSAADCPAGKACTTKTHTCSPSCDAANPCNGGCCSAAVGGTCTAGTVDGACGNTGASCADCALNSNGHRCIGGQCGCNGPLDCPSGASGCTNHLCINQCSSSQPCGSGCCTASSNGTCQLGTAPTACGDGVQCVDCTSNASGHACVSGSCGCNSATDCPSGKACDPTTHKCTSTCNATQPCNGACCSGGLCITNQSATACGSSGLCASCTTSPSGRLCISGSCGCNSSADCPQFTACNPITHSCSASCAGGLTCNGGCCDGTNTCTNGSGNSACGSGGGPCVACPTGSTCVSGVCKSNSSSCTAASQCVSGFCVDGFCCNSACTGKCQACDLPASLGTCATVTSGQPHGSRGACAGSGTCQGTCDGSSATACTFPTTQCRAPSCSVSTKTLAASCDGAGNCPAVVTQSCGHYLCAGTTCGTSCSTDGNCTSDAWCCAACPSGCVCNQCYPKRADGVGCDAGANYQCSSNVCKQVFKDDDGDGYGAGTAYHFCGATPPTGYAASSTDCCDQDASAKPNQTGWFTTTNKCGSWDYNCDTLPNRRYPSGFQGCTFANQCGNYGYPCNTSSFVAGWGSATATYTFAPASAPACGQSGTWIQVCWTNSTIFPCGNQVYCDFGNISNTLPPLTRAQECH